MSSKKGGGATRGFRYYFSLLMGVCRGPVDQIFLVKSAGTIIWDGAGIEQSEATLAADTSGENAATVWNGGPVTNNATAVPITRPNAYGGDDREGGVVGQMDVMMGGRTQLVSDKIKSALEGLRLSSMRGVLTVFFDGEVCANTPYPKAFKFRVRRAIKGWDGDPWYPERAVIMLTDPAIPAFSQTVIVPTEQVGGYNYTIVTDVNGSTSTTYTAIDGTQAFASDSASRPNLDGTQVPLEYNSIYAMNGAHIIYECCTNRDWGRGMPRELMDEPSFASAANQLWIENFGLCMKWSRSDDVDVFLQTVVDHIGGVIYTDKLTGLLCLRLIRADYVESDLPVFDYEHGLLSVTVAEAAAQDTTPNEVVVKYFSPVLENEKETRAQNIASVGATGSIFSVTHQYPGLPTSTLAIQVAQRDLKVLSIGMKRVTFKVDRRGYRMVPGDVVIVNAPDRGLPMAVLRVAMVEDTSLTNGEITANAVLDSFDHPLVPFTKAQPSTFLMPDLEVHPVTVQYGVAATYRDVYKFGGAALAEGLNETASYAVLVAAAPTKASYAFDMQSSVDHFFGTGFSPFEDKGTAKFAKYSTLVKGVGTTDTVFQITGGINPRTVTPGTGLLIEGDEFIRLDSITETPAGRFITVGRGCVDTFAQAWAAGKRIWAYDQTGVADPTEYVDHDFVKMRALTKTSRGRLPPERAVQEAYALLYSRPVRPYIGANFRLNGVARDAMDLPLGPELVFTWEHRDRKLIADKLIDELQPGIGPEPGTSYFVLLYGSGGVGTFTSTGNTLTVTQAMMTAAGFQTGTVSLIFYAEKSGVAAQRSRSHSIIAFTFKYKLNASDTPVVVVPPTVGWGANFGSNFGGGA